jgi:serine/threonine protein kinase
MEQLTDATGKESLEELTALVRRTLDERDDLRQQFDATLRDVRRMTLSLSRIEEKLDIYFHVQQKVALSLEDLKSAFIESPLLGDWAEFRKARPDAVKALNDADEHFLAGRRDEGARVLIDLLKQRGIGEATVCRHLGLVSLVQGRLPDARDYLTRAAGAAGSGLPSGVIHTMVGLSTASTRGTALSVWRSLPRGVLVDRRYRIETEVGRGGMASVYRAVCVDWVNPGLLVALKVPAPDLLADPAARARFITEIQVAQKLSGRHNAVIQTLGYAVFDDPHNPGRELYGLVMEFINGPSLAQFLAQRQAQGRPLTPDEVLHLLRPVGEALACAHDIGVFHRDLKPHNVMLANEAGQTKVKLMDFGIARVLEDSRATLLGQNVFVGTLAYSPPDREFDARSDVYLMGNLLLEMLTFDARGDLESRKDCPPAWVDLVNDAMSRGKNRRPASAKEFLTRLEVGLGRIVESAPPAPVAIPVVPHDRIRELIGAQRFEEAMQEYRRLPLDQRQPALLQELQNKWRSRAHALAREAAETDGDFATAVSLIEKLPESLRDGAVLADYRMKRDWLTPPPSYTPASFRNLYRWLVLLTVLTFLLPGIGVGGMALGESTSHYTDDYYRYWERTPAGDILFYGGIIVAAAGAVPLIAAISIFAVLLYRCWYLIQGYMVRDSGVRLYWGKPMMPGRAVGFLFVPIFNLFWVFAAVFGLAQEMDTIAQRSDSRQAIPTVPPPLALIWCILFVSIFVPFVDFVTLLPMAVIGLILMNLFKNAAIGILKARTGNAATAVPGTEAAEEESSRRPLLLIGLAFTVLVVLVLGVVILVASLVGGGVSTKAAGSGQTTAKKIEYQK